MSTIEQLIEKVLSGNASKAEERTLNALMANSEKNRKLFEEHQLLFQFTRAAKKKITTDEVDVDAAWSRFAQLKEQESKRPANGWLKIASVAVVVLLAGAMGSYFIYNGMQDEPTVTAHNKSMKPAMADTATVEVAVVNQDKNTVKKYRRSNKQLQDDGFTMQVLPDSSVVTLGPGSVLKALEYSDEHRVVSLAGAGFFNLKPMDQDFVIETKELVIRVEGTKFNVKTETEDYKFIELFVEEGSMEAYEVGNPSNKVILTSNESYLYDIEKHEFVKIRGNNNGSEENTSRWKRFVNKISKPFRKKKKDETEEE